MKDCLWKYNRDAQIINSQVADELLNIKGVKASFVAGKNDSGKTVVSARSLGELNVQVICAVVRRNIENHFISVRR